MDSRQDHERFIRRAVRTTGAALLGAAGTAAFLMMCWYLFGICDLTYINF